MMHDAPVPSSRTPEEVWADLLEGNRRFAAGEASHPGRGVADRERLMHGQAPEAVVLGCADSRVPPEIIFDAALGEVFDVRTAGEILDDAVVASLEYAVDHLHAKVLVVLGHEGCGAVSAAAEYVDEIARQCDDCDDFADDEDEDLDALAAAGAIVDRAAHADEMRQRRMQVLLGLQESPILRDVGESVRASRAAELYASDDYERTHVARTIEMLVRDSAVIRDAVADGRLAIAGARYVMRTGLVEVLSF